MRGQTELYTPQTCSSPRRPPIYMEAVHHQEVFLGSSILIFDRKRLQVARYGITKLIIPLMKYKIIIIPG